MTRMHGNRESWLSALRAEATAFRAAAAAPGALDAPVPSCPGWSMRDLVHHLGLVYNRISGHVARAGAPPTEPLADPVGLGLPAGEAALAWWDAEYTALVSLLDGLDPDTPVWNWAPQPKTAVFWARRMAHETAMHRWDAQMAIGSVEPIETKLAADGVTEVLDTWLPSGRRRGPTDRLGVVQLDATDLDESWLVRLRGEGVALLDTDTLFDAEDPHARTLARGTASDLVLTLLGRVPFDILDVSGDATLLHALRTG
jgi:uncharacterized protein (TIGR03083 family)